MAPTPLLFASRRSVTQVTGATRRSIRRTDVASVRVFNVELCKIGRVQEVVHEREEVGGVGGRGVAGVCGRSIRLTREVGRRARVVGVLPKEGEFVHEIGVAIAGGKGCDEHNQAFVVVNHGLEGWPAGGGAALRGWFVGIVGDVGGCELSVEFGRRCVIRVDEEDGDDWEWLDCCFLLLGFATYLHWGCHRAMI